MKHLILILLSIILFSCDPEDDPTGGGDYFVKASIGEVSLEPEYNYITQSVMAQYANGEIKDFHINVVVSNEDNESAYVSILINSDRSNLDSFSANIDIIDNCSEEYGSSTGNITSSLVNMPDQVSSGTIKATAYCGFNVEEELTFEWRLPIDF